MFLNIPNSGSPSWKTSVANSAALPTTGNTSGDARIALDTQKIYVWSGSAWVASAGGGSSNSFTIMQTPLGTSPTAVTSTDTLNFTSSDSSVTITGNSGTDTIDFKAASGFSNPMTTSGDTIYGASSGTATRLAGSTLATKQFLTQTGNGSISAAPIWGAIVTGDIPTTLTSKTLTTPTINGLISGANAQAVSYNILTTDSVILASANAGNITVALPTAVGVTGQVYTIKRTDTAAANKVTVGVTLSQSIDGMTGINLYTQYEQLTVISNGTNWNVLNHTWPVNWTSYTPTYTGFGTVSGSSIFYRRIADSIEIWGKFTAGTTTAVEARMTLPNGWLSDNNKTVSIRHNGTFTMDANSASSGYTLIEANIGYITFGLQGTGSSGLTKITATSIATGTTISISCIVPIGGWFG